MQNLTIIQLSESDLKRIIRDEIRSIVETNETSSEIETHNEFGGIDLAVEITGKAKPTIYSLCSLRQIPHSKKGKKLYFSRKELLKWISDGKRKTETEIAEEAEGYIQNKTRTNTATNDKSFSNQ